MTPSPPHRHFGQRPGDVPSQGMASSLAHSSGAPVSQVPNMPTREELTSHLWHTVGIRATESVDTVEVTPTMPPTLHQDDVGLEEAKGAEEPATKGPQEPTLAVGVEPAPLAPSPPQDRTAESPSSDPVRPPTPPSATRRGKAKPPKRSNSPKHQRQEPPELTSPIHSHDAQQAQATSSGGSSSRSRRRSPGGSGTSHRGRKKASV